MRIFSGFLVVVAVSSVALACSRSNPGIQSEPVRVMASSSAPVASAAPSAAPSELATAPISDAPREAPSAAPHANEPSTAGGALVVPRSARDEEAVREATFRYLIGGHNASGQGKGAALFCLQVENAQDPSPALLRHFHDVNALIRPVSACSASAVAGVTDKATGKHGLIFRVEKITFTDDDHVEVGGGYYEAGLSASGNTYSLERKKSGTWFVTRDVMHWIS